MRPLHLSPCFEGRVGVEVATATSTPGECFTAAHRNTPIPEVSQLPDPTDPEYLERPSGRGLLLMRAFTDDVRYNSKGNQVTLVKKRA